MISSFPEFDGRKFRSIAKGEVDFADEPATEEEADVVPEKQELLNRIGEVLGDAVSEVRASRRLTESASCLVLGEQEMALHMRHMLEQAGQKLPAARPVLEVNLEHPLVKRLEGDEPESVFSDLAHILFGQAVLSEGGQLEDPAGFVQRLNRIMLTA